VCVRATRSVRISVDCQFRGGRISQEESKIQGTSEITPNVLHGSEVGLTGIIHVEADLLDVRYWRA
jgi:hypothetical protein